MKINELRIGNWVNQPQLPHIAKVTAIDYSGDDYYCKFENIHPACWCSHIESIPITEELLLKCGFQKRSESRCTMILPLEHGDPLTDKLCPSIQWWIGNDYMSICRCGISALSIKIESLHQLQNLFYYLTGEELNINL